MKVSIVVPVWGTYIKYLEQCRDSIKKQTFKDYEIIVVKNKKTMSSARNEGIKQAKGEYILTLDVDDTIDPQFLEKTLAVGGDIITTATNKNGEYWLPGKEITKRDMLKDNQIISGSLFKRKIWEKIGGFDEKLKVGLEDWDFWLRAVMAGYEVNVIEEALYNYNQRPDGMQMSLKNKLPMINYIRSKHIKYSVIIPTMWVSDKIERMIKVYNKSPYISEVLIINNLPEKSKDLKSKKVREIYRGKNIYVNPAWNLGAKEAKEENIIIANDDVYIEDLDKLLKEIILEDNSIIGPSTNCFNEETTNVVISSNPKNKTDQWLNFGFGTFMILKKESFIKIPKDYLIYDGDVIQCRRNEPYCFEGIHVDTEMSETLTKHKLKDMAEKEIDRSKYPKLFDDLDLPKLLNFLDEITFVIKTYYRYAPLGDLMDSIFKYYRNAKIIILDDTPDDLFDDDFYQHYINVMDLRLIRTEENIGISAGRNILAEYTKTPFMLLLEDDFIFTDKTDIQPLWNVLCAFDDVSIAGGSCIRDGEIQDYQFNLIRNGTCIVKTKLTEVLKLDELDYYKADFVSNFAMFKTEILKRIKWNEELKICEHLPFYLDFLEVNSKAVYVPSVKIDHVNVSDSTTYKATRKKKQEHYVALSSKLYNIKNIVEPNGDIKPL